MNRAGPLRIVLAEGHGLIRYGLRCLLDKSCTGCSFLEAETLAEAIEHLEMASRDRAAGLLVIDLGLPGMNGSASIRPMRQAYPELRIAVLTGTGDRETMLGCLAAGAHGCMPKTEAPERVAQAILTVLQGGVRTKRPALPSLTARQQDVLTLLTDGQSTKDIARHLDLGIGTVKVHLAGLYRSLNVRNRTEAVTRVRSA